MRTVDDFAMDPADQEYWLAQVARIVDDLDPVPDGLVERAQFAIAIENIDAEVEIEAALWADHAATGVRGGVAPLTMSFFVDDLAIMISVTRTGQCRLIDGWLVPAGEHNVEVRVAGHESSVTTADDGGRFVLTDVPRGTTQIVVRTAGATPRTLVTPVMEL
ncbi:MAG: carboxypeptidase regulatory-like domain-containing protein [Actinomycetota bacterium]|nr:carboxypeptidase regulatory-like domain-containing protein [Actinomycetota bacterium]